MGKEKIKKLAVKIAKEHAPVFLKLRAEELEERKHIKETCVAFQEGGMGCPDCYCDSTCKDDGCPICGGNTSERIANQVERLERLADIAPGHWICDACGVDYPADVPNRVITTPTLSGIVMCPRCVVGVQE